MPAITTRRKAWRDWLLRAAAGSPDADRRSCTASRGERRLTEWECRGCPAIADAAPVRIGNAAPYAVAARCLWRDDGRAAPGAQRRHCRQQRPAWAMQRALLDHLETIWHEPDEGIWESARRPRHFTYSKVMAWVAFDRAIKSAEQFGLTGPSSAGGQLRDAIHQRSLRATASNREAGRFRRSLRRRCSSTPACCCCRRSAFCRLQIRASLARSRRSSSDLMRRRLCRRYDTAMPNGRTTAGRRRFPGLQLLAGRCLCS